MTGNGMKKKLMKKINGGGLVIYKNWCDLYCDRYCGRKTGTDKTQKDSQYEYRE